MSLSLTLATIESHVAQVGASLRSIQELGSPAQVAAELAGLRGEIGLFLDRYGIDVTDEVWAKLVLTMERVDGAIAWIKKADVHFA